MSAPEPSAEDAKLVTLARGARTRAYVPHTGAAAGAALRDVDGRTYAAATVEHADAALTTTALQGALSAAASSGARRFEAVALVADGPAALTEVDLARLREFGSGVPVLLADASGAVHETVVVSGPNEAL